MSSLGEVPGVAMLVFAAADGLLLYQMAREVNNKLEQQGSGRITPEEYGWRFLKLVLREHGRLFPDSSKRTWWVLIGAIGVIGCVIVPVIVEKLL